MAGTTDDPNDPGLKKTDLETGLQDKYLVLSDEERSKGFVEPYRDSYVHQKCGVATTIGREIAETYARNPQFYGSTYCANCQNTFSIGADGEFVWKGTDQKVGTRGNG